MNTPFLDVGLIKGRFLNVLSKFVNDFGKTFSLFFRLFKSRLRCLILRLTILRLRVTLKRLKLLSKWRDESSNFGGFFRRADHPVQGVEKGVGCRKFRVWGGEPPPSCKIVEEEVEVPARKEIRRKLVCGDDEAASAAKAAMRGTVSRMEGSAK